MQRDLKYLFRQVPIFKGLSDAGFSQLNNVSDIDIKSFPKECEIELDDFKGAISILVRGNIQLCLNSIDKKYVVKCCTPWDVIADDDLIGAIYKDVHANVLIDSEILVIPTKCLDSLSLDDRDMYQNNLKTEYTQMLFEIMDDLMILSVPRAEERVLRYLMKLPLSENSDAIIPLSRVDLAAQLSLADKTLIRSLRSLSEKGIITISGRHVRINQNVSFL